MVLDPADMADLTARQPRVVTERMAIERFLARWREFQHLIPPGVKAMLYEPVRDMREAVGR